MYLPSLFAQNPGSPEKRFGLVFPLRIVIGERVGWLGDRESGLFSALVFLVWSFMTPPYSGTRLWAGSMDGVVGKLARIRLKSTTQEKTTMVPKRILVTLLVCLSFAPLLEASRSVVGTPTDRLSSEKVLRMLRFATTSDNRRFDILAISTAQVSTDPNGFGLEQVAFIRNWFSQQVELGTLPVEMVKHDAPPPLRREGVLPEDLRERVQPLPAALESQLPTLSGNLRRGIVLGDVVLIEEDTAKIVDLIPGAL